MSTNSKIEWTHHTFNPWRGCTKISAGCKHCYADTLSKRNPKVLGIWGKNGTRAVAAESYWREPVKWDRAAKAAGERHRVFCASLADIAEGADTMPPESWDAVQKARGRLVATFSTLDNLDLLLLTKRPENLLDLYPAEFLARCWVGTSLENQDAADKRVVDLLRVPAKLRFLSCEPLIGRIDLSRFYADEVDVNRDGSTAYDTIYHPLTGIKTSIQYGFSVPGPAISWVICGGESGPNARPMHPDHARLLRDQCVTNGVAFHFKQWGEWLPYDMDAQPPFWSSSADGEVVDGHCFPDRISDGEEIDGWLAGDLGSDDYQVMYRHVGKVAAGRFLDGRTWDELPEVA